jgi:thymidylate synthase (methanogen type)
MSAESRFPPNLIRAFSIPDAYFELNRAIWNKGVGWTSEGPHSRRTKALLNVVLHVTNPEVRPLSHPSAPVSEDFITTYTYTSVLSSERVGEEAYTYGERLKKVSFSGTELEYDQLKISAELLKRSPRTRRCVLVLARVDDLERSDPCCMREIHLWIEQPKLDRLHMFSYFRSWDAYKAANANLGALQLLQEEIAQQVGVKTGTITVFATNAHVYEEDFARVKELLEGSKRAQQWWSKS